MSCVYRLPSEVQRSLQKGSYTHVSGRGHFQCSRIGGSVSQLAYRSSRCFFLVLVKAASLWCVCFFLAVIRVNIEVIIIILTVFLLDSWLVVSSPSPLPWYLSCLDREGCSLCFDTAWSHWAHPGHRRRKCCHNRWFAEVNCAFVSLLIPGSSPWSLALNISLLCACW